MNEVLVSLAVLLAVAGNVPYLHGMWKGVVKPHPYTWLVGSIISLTVFFGMVEKGAGLGALPVLVSGFFTVAIFLFSLKYGFKKIARVDTVFLVLALLGLVPWLLTQDPTISIGIAVTVDILSLLPTFRKTWSYPDTEHSWLYGSNILRHSFVLLTLSTYNVATMTHSIAMIIINIGMLLVMYRKRLFGKRGVHTHG